MSKDQSASGEYIGSFRDGRHAIRLVCAAEPASDATAPGSAERWIQVCPYGPIVSARDGRSFQISDAPRVAARSEVPALLDWDHQSERWNGSTAAAGWCEEYAVEDGRSGRFPRPGIWARVDLTPEGAEDVSKKRFRFTSPVLAIDPESRDVLEILAIALTNRPALHMAGIDAYRAQFSARYGQQLQGGDATMMSRAPAITPAARRSLHAKGMTDEQIEKAQQYRVQQLAEVSSHRPAPASPVARSQRRAYAAAPSSAAARDVSAEDRVLLSRGMAQADIDRARKYIADRRAAVER